MTPVPLKGEIPEKAREGQFRIVEDARGALLDLFEVDIIGWLCCKYLSRAG